MKRGILVLALLAIVATGTFAQGFSMAAGGGALFDWSSGSGIKGSANFGTMSGSFEGRMQNLSFGGFVFFDATYAELDVNFAYGIITAKTTSSGNWTGWENSVESGLLSGNQLQLGFTLLGKYPIGLGGFTLFPLLGVDYNRVLSYKAKNGDTQKNPGDISQIGLLGGVGFDISFSNALFLRAEAMFHFRFPDKIMKDSAALMSKGGYYNVDATYGMGPNIKIGLGYRFGGGSYMTVNADTLNVRRGPSADTALVGTLKRGTRVEVLSRSGTWWKIKSGKIEGYVNSSYLK